MSGHPPSPTHSLRLVDGRRLARYEYGDPHGTLCVYTAGAQASGLGGRTYDGAAQVRDPARQHDELLQQRLLAARPSGRRNVRQALEIGAARAFAEAARSGQRWYLARRGIAARRGGRSHPAIGRAGGGCDAGLGTVPLRRSGRTTAFHAAQQLAFRRLHLAGGVTAGGKRLLSEALAA